MARELAVGPEDSSRWDRPPTWLLVPSSGTVPDPPVETRPQLLPCERLRWEDFERLCLRLLARDGEVIHVVTHDAEESARPVTRLYGARGQAQAGIDIYAREPLALGALAPPRRYACLQARRTEDVTAGQLRDAVADFQSGRWAPVTRRFIFATSSPAVATRLSEEYEQLASELASQSIEFELWDAEHLSDLLHDLPGLVDSFFGRAWVERFIGPEAVAQFSKRLDAAQVAALRRELANVYEAAFAVADSGLLPLRVHSPPTGGIRERFVTPEIVATLPTGDVGDDRADDRTTQPAMPDVASAVADAEASFNTGSTDWNWTTRLATTSATSAVVTTGERTPADTWLGRELRHVVVGEPGAGKSTLLRFLVLDLLSESPSWQSVAERWGDRLPVWLPFHFLTQRVADRSGEEASVRGALRTWLEQHDVGGVWPLVEAALDDDRLLLVVDGLDEWVNEDAGRYAAAALETFVLNRRPAVVVSTRPYGLSKLALGAAWSHGRIAPLRREKQRELALHYFRSTIGEDGDSGVQAGVIERALESFFATIDAAADLRTLCATPLFLVLLIGLRLSDVRLPERRFEVYDRVVQLLIQEHPARRRSAAAIAASRAHPISDRETRVVLAAVAFAAHRRGDVAAIDETVLRQDLIAALRDPDHLALPADAAWAKADELLDIAEGELGLLVREGPRELGFIHRVLQDELAAEHAADRLTIEGQRDLFAERLGDGRWRETLLAIVWRLRRASDLRSLLDAVEIHVNETPEGLRAREFLAEIVFGPYGLPGSDLPERIASTFSVVEDHAYERHRRRLLASVVSGLEQASTAEAVAQRLEHWAIRVRQPSPYLTRLIGDVPVESPLFSQAAGILLRAVRLPNPEIAYTAAIALADAVNRGEGEAPDERRRMVEDGLRAIVTHPPTGLAAAAALCGLALAFSEHGDTHSALTDAIGQSYEPLRLIALASKLGVLSHGVRDGATDSAAIASREASEDERSWLARRLDAETDHDTHFGLLVTTIAAVFAGDPGVRDHCLAILDERPGGDESLVWNTMLAAYSEDAAVVEFLRRRLHEQYPWPLLGLFAGAAQLARAYPVGSASNPAIVEAIETHLQTFERHHAPDLYHLAAIDQGPAMREVLLAELEEGAFPHWSAAALVDHFSGDEEAITRVRSVLAGEPVRASHIANVAPKVLEPRATLARLLEIARDARESAEKARYDFVVAALTQASAQLGLTDGSEADEIAKAILDSLPAVPGAFPLDPRFEIAVAFRKTQTGRLLLQQLSEEPDVPPELFILAYRDDEERLQPHLQALEPLFSTVSPGLRALANQLLADRVFDPLTVTRLTRRWADDVDEPVKSVAALAFHRALVRGRELGLIDEQTMQDARAQLRTQAAIYGPDHEARRRAAWVGLAVTREWSIVDDLNETIGEPHPVAIDLGHVLYGTDRVLVQELAQSWESAREHFGSQLLPRLAGKRTADQATAWSHLALVADQAPQLAHELEVALAANPSLLAHDGVLAWYVTRPNRNRGEIADALLGRLGGGSTNSRGVASFLIAEPERLGLEREELRQRLEQTAGHRAAPFGDSALEALARLFPEHPRVRAEWQRISESLGRGESLDVHPRTYLELAYAAVEPAQLLQQLRRDLRWLNDRNIVYYDGAFADAVVHRLRLDPTGSGQVRAAAVDDDARGEEPALLLSLLSAAHSADATIVGAARSRMHRENRRAAATIVRDRLERAPVSALTVLTSIAETAHVS